MGIPSPLHWVADERLSPLQRLVRVQLLVELAFLPVWIAFFVTFEVWTTTPGMDAARLSLVISLLGHLGTPLALIALNHGLSKRHVGWERWFLMFGNLFTDVWSALDAWLHLQDKDASAEALSICRAFTTMALVTSSLAVAVYLYALIKQAAPEDAGLPASLSVLEQLLPQRPTRVRPMHHK